LPFLVLPVPSLEGIYPSTPAMGRNRIKLPASGSEDG
jgi:hypothetical protein